MISRPSTSHQLSQTWPPLESTDSVVPSGGNSPVSYAIHLAYLPMLCQWRDPYYLSQPISLHPFARVAATVPRLHLFVSPCSLSLLKIIPTQSLPARPIRLVMSRKPHQGRRGEERGAGWGRLECCVCRSAAGTVLGGTPDWPATLENSPLWRCWHGVPTYLSEDK